MAATTSARAAKPKTPAPGVRLLIATRKGLWTLGSDGARRTWKLAGPQFLGNIVHHCVADPRDGKTVLAAARTGHLGPTVFRSGDGGRTWREAAQPPAFKPDSGRSVDHTFWLAPGHASEPGVWYAGTSPQGLFRSEDSGATWVGVDGFNDHPRRKEWCGGDQDGTPDGPKLHSILIDPRDPKHMYFGMSGGGVFESTDAGADWRPLNRGVRVDFCPIPIPSSVMIRIACVCIRCNPTASISKTTRVSIASTGLPSGGPTSVPRCRRASAPSVFPWRCIPTIRRPCGCSRWTAAASGRGCRRAVSPRCISPSMALAYMAAAKHRHAGGAGVVDRQAPGNDDGPHGASGRLLRYNQR